MMAAGLLFIAGLTSSWHCIGMCGGFPVMLANGQSSPLRQLLYNLARVNTLVFIGAVSELKVVWDISDTLNGLMAIPNLVAVLGSLALLRKLNREYFAKNA